MMKLPKIVAENLEKAGGLRSLERSIPPRRRVNLVGAVFQSMSDPIRLSILHAVSAAPLCVCVIKSIVKISDSKLSYHLDSLKRAGLVTARPEGKFIVYEITNLGRTLLSACDNIE